jgi:hypothetical protein
MPAGFWPDFGANSERSCGFPEGGFRTAKKIAAAYRIFPLVTTSSNNLSLSTSRARLQLSLSFDWQP